MILQFKENNSPFSSLSNISPLVSGVHESHVFVRRIDGSSKSSPVLSVVRETRSNNLVHNHTVETIHKRAIRGRSGFNMKECK